MRSLVGMYLPLFCIVDLETYNVLMPDVGELMMLNRLLIVPAVEHATGVNLCMLLLRPRGSMVLWCSQGGRIMSAPGIL